MMQIFKGGLQFASKWSPFHQKSGLQWRLFVVPKLVNISVFLTKFRSVDLNLNTTIMSADKKCNVVYFARV